ncbi:ribosomal protein l7/l12-like protein [Novymonas esmeraldas]|uniref:Ribosomal protein l7/l12-like protein n=1 Tax=Novymonas esmeraldas TaxID=1808958 RepID=A0AAW0EWT8_9TRYP
MLLRPPFARPAVLPPVAGAALLVARRTLIRGVASHRIPRGMAPLGVRCSADAVEELAEAYVNMDAITMTAFHKKAMQAMLRSSGDSSGSGGGGAAPAPALDYEGQLLHAMGGGGGDAVVSAPPAAAAVANGGTAPAASEAAPPAKKAAEKTAFDVALKKFPAESKIKLIRELRSVCGLGIQEAKTAIESAPGVVARQVQTADAERLKEAMVKLGAEVELL